MQPTRDLPSCHRLQAVRCFPRQVGSPRLAAGAFRVTAFEPREGRVTESWIAQADGDGLAITTPLFLLAVVPQFLDPGRPLGARRSPWRWRPPTDARTRAQPKIAATSSVPSTRWSPGARSAGSSSPPTRSRCRAVTWLPAAANMRRTWW